jgi:hypothetical protein
LEVDTESEVVSTVVEAPTDAHPFQNGLLVVEAATGNVIQHATSNDLSNQIVLTNIPGSFFIAGNETPVYAAHTGSGTVLKVVSDGMVMDTPKVISSGHDSPEKIPLLKDDYLFVVSAGSGTLYKIDISSGESTMLVEGFKCLPPFADFGIVFGLTNNVTVHDCYAYVNADESNDIYIVDLNADCTSGGVEMLNGGVVTMVLLAITCSPLLWL